MKILVTGATGYIGGRLVPKLIEVKHSVRVMARQPRKLQWRGWSGVEVVEGDALDYGSLLAALSGVEVAYYLIHSMTTSGKDFAERDKEAALNFARAASAANVKRIIYLGGLGITGSDLSEHLRSRHETGSLLRSTGVPVTELRAAIIVGSGSASFTIIYDLVRKLPVMICPKWVQSRCEPISIRQVMHYLVAVLEEPRSIGETLEIGGGEILSYREMMLQCAQMMNRRLSIIDVPILTPRLSSYWLNLVTGVPMTLARPLVEGLKNDVICSDTRIRKWIPSTELTFKESVKLALNKMESRQIESEWTSANTAHSSRAGDSSPAPLSDLRKCRIEASPSKVFCVIQKIGADRGWYHADWLWRARAAIDWLVGGVGMRRGRRDLDQLEVGDPLDFWRVEDIQQDALLVLRAEMQLPGTARLIFRLERQGENLTLLNLHALFWPNGLFGKVYWYTVLPLHSYVFNGLMKAIRERAVSP